MSNDQIKIQTENVEEKFRAFLNKMSQGIKIEDLDLDIDLNDTSNPKMVKIKKMVTHLLDVNI